MAYVIRNHDNPFGNSGVQEVQGGFGTDVLASTTLTGLLARCLFPIFILSIKDIIFLNEF